MEVLEDGYRRVIADKFQDLAGTVRAAVPTGMLEDADPSLLVDEAPDRGALHGAGSNAVQRKRQP